MTEREHDAQAERGAGADPSRGPDESGIGAQSHSSPQGDGAERGANRGGKRDLAGTSRTADDAVVPGQARDQEIPADES